MSRLSELIQGLCPDGVEYKRLDEIFNTKNGYTPSKSNANYWNGDTCIPWFRMEDIREHGNILTDSIQHVTLAAIKGELFPENSIIVATSATIGEHALIKVKSLANQRFTYLVLKEEYQRYYDIKFLYYYCYKLDEWCLTHLNQSNFASVDMGKFYTFMFPIPPLEVQHEIVRILDIFKELTMELTTKLTKELIFRKKQYEYYRKQLFVFGNEIQWMTIDEICEKITSGGTPKTGDKNYYGGNIPWLRTQEIDWNNIYDTGIKITEEGLANSSAKWIKKNCVIVAMYGATAAKVAINKIPLTTNQACCNLQIDNKKALYQYVYYWLSKEYLSLKSLGQGSQSNINIQIIKQYKIPIPSLQIQQDIVTILENFNAICTNLNINLPLEIEARKKQYEYYRDKLLTFKELKT